MANADAPFGFRPVRHMAGGTPGRLNRYPITSAYATNIFTGDIVSTVAAGTVEIASAGTIPLGVFMGCEYILTDGTIKFSKYWPASQATLSGSTRWAYVADDPQIEMEVQSDGTMTIADVGQLCDLATTTAGSTTTGLSGMQTTATGNNEVQFRIVAIVDDKPVRDSAGNQGYSAAGLNALLRVKFGLHAFAGTSAGEV